MDPKAKWIPAAVVSGTGNGRIGDLTVSATCGFPFSATVPFKTPAIAELTSQYKLYSIYVLVPAGLTVSITLGR